MQLPKIHISVSTAIRSRAQIFEVKPLTEADIHVAIQRALTDKEKRLRCTSINLDETAEQYLARVTNGDLRSALNALELAARSTPANPDTNVIDIDIDVIEECVQKKSHYS